MPRATSAPLGYLSEPPSLGTHRQPHVRTPPPCALKRPHWFCPKNMPSPAVTGEAGGRQRRRSMGQVCKGGRAWSLHLLRPPGHPNQTSGLGCFQPVLLFQLQQKYPSYPTNNLANPNTTVELIRLPWVYRGCWCANEETMQAEEWHCMVSTWALPATGGHRDSK